LTGSTLSAGFRGMVASSPYMLTSTRQLQSGPGENPGGHYALSPGID